MIPLAEQLTGEIPGLLRRGSPVTCTSDCDGVVALVYTNGAIAVAISDREIEPSSPDIYALDLTSRTGRFHAREWLAEHGHDVGSEDRAEVLAWSVLSVWRGGKPLKGITPAWAPQSCGWWGRVAGMLEYALVGKSGSWATFPGRTYFPLHCSFRRESRTVGGKEGADAALIADGWALTNPDGSLTLPPLPEVA